MFKKIIVLLPLVALMSANRIPVPGERIVGGDKINIEIVPWQVAILGKEQAMCGGAIYQERIILTAAHCLERDQDYSVRAGSASKSFGGQEVKVAKSIARNGSDIAILFLSSPLKFDQFTKPIELAETSPVAETYAIASGWGWQSFNSAAVPGPDHLRAVNVMVTDRTRCQAAVNAMAVLLGGEPEILKDDEICASLQGDGGIRPKADWHRFLWYAMLVTGCLCGRIGSRKQPTDTVTNISFSGLKIKNI